MQGVKSNKSISTGVLSADHLQQLYRVGFDQAWTRIWVFEAADR